MPDPLAPNVPTPRVFQPLAVWERVLLGLGALAEAILLCWAGWILPWQSGTWFAVLSLATAAAHLATAVFCCVPRSLAVHCWRWASLLGFTWCLGCAWITLSSGWYLAELYGGLGRGVAALLLVILVLCSLAALPLAAWGCLRVGPPRLPRATRTLTVLSCLGLGLALGAAALGPWQLQRARRALPMLDEPLRELASVAARLPPATEATPKTPLPVKTIARCRQSPQDAKFTAIAVFRARGDGRSRAVCEQGARPAEVLQLLTQHLEAEAGLAPIALDIVDEAASFDLTPPWMTPFGMRPGLDGACVAGACLTPWQLLGRSAFANHSPVAFFPEIRFGVAPDELRRWLVKKGQASSAQGAGLTRIGTRSYVLGTDGSVTPLRRMIPFELAATSERMANAATLFEQHILEAQLPDGKFRYLLDPYTGETESRNFVLARQAGTAYALCDVGAKTRAVDAAARAALQLLTRHLRVGEDPAVAGLAFENERVLPLGTTALGLVAFLSCRERVGAEFDGAIRQLAGLVVALAREDGSFAPAYDLGKQRARSGSQQLYAEGQAVLGLVLLEQLARAAPADLPWSADALAERVERSMTYTATRYWQRAMYPFFFLEENWHCLAARAALTTHPHRGYQDFCLDYVRFKSRLILDARSEVDPELFGAFGLGQLVPPHSAGGAGFGEAVAAGIALERSRGTRELLDAGVMQNIVTMIVRHQWSAEKSFASALDARGAFLEQVHSPIARIDFAQHAWLALAHGQRELQLL